MMKKSALSIALAALLALAAAPIFAEEEAAEETAAGIAVTIEGLNYNLLSTLAEDHVEEAPAEYAGINALKITTCTDGEGKVHEALAGTTVHYIPCKHSADLMVGATHAGATVTVKGTLFPAENALLVESFEAASGDDWDELDLGTLSGQQVL